jgi:hypothetical protein
MVLIIILLWLLALVNAFLFSRGEDIWHSPLLFNNLARGPIFGFAGFIDSLLGVLTACLIVAAWYGVGSLMILAVKKINDNQTNENNSKILDLARTCGFGAVAWSLFWFFIGLAGGYNLTISTISLLIGLTLFVLFAFRSWKSRESVEETNTTDVIGKIAFGITLLILLITLISAIAPPTAKDALLYHFAVPKSFISAGNNAVIEGNIASYLALGTEMQVVWAMLLGKVFSFRVGEIAASATVFAFFPLLLLATYGWARELGLDKKWAMVSALLIATIPTAYHVASSGYIDLALAFYITLAIHAIGHWWKNLGSEWLFYTALCLGTALAIKLTALFAVVAIGLTILLRVRLAQNDETKNSWVATSLLLQGITTLACAGILASPWYIRNWIKTGSPFFPFYLNVWNGTAPGWDAKRSVLFQVINSQYGGSAKGILDYLIAPLTISLRAQPELPQYFDGVLGVAFLFGLPLIIWAYRRSLFTSNLKIALLVSGCLFVFWLFTSQQLRYLLPIFPSLAVAIAFSCYSLAQNNKTLRQALAAALLCISIVSGSTTLAWFAQKSPIQVVLGGESPEDFLIRSLDYYPYYQIINIQLPANSKIWLVNMRRDTYHVDKPYFSDYMFEDYTFRQLTEESKTVAELQTKAKQLGITHLLVRHDFLLDYKQSVLVDDARSEKENLDKLKVARDFILNNKNVIRSDNKFTLVKIE